MLCSASRWACRCRDTIRRYLAGIVALCLRAMIFRRRQTCSELRRHMARPRKKLAAGIAICGIVIGYTYYGLRPYSWQLDHRCWETGSVLADEIFLRNAFEYEASEVQNHFWSSGSSLASGRYASSIDELEAQFPECCEVYLGPPADIITPPSLWARITNRFPKAVLVELHFSYKYQGRVVSHRQKQITMLNACAKPIPHSQY